jgi:hypothetical protein
MSNRLANPAIFDGNFITRHFFSHIDVKEINFGECYHWAYCAYKVFHKCNIELWSSVVQGGHAFIKMNGKFYDSESPQGVDSYTDLEYYKRGFESKAKAQALEEFKAYWWGRFDAYDERFIREGFIKR